MSLEDAATASTRWGTYGAYTYPLARCRCHGRQPRLNGPSAGDNLGQQRAPLNSTQTSCSVWVGFLLDKNDEYVPGGSLSSSLMNRAAVWLTGAPYIHCQMVFWDEERQVYYTYSVDDTRPVHVWDRKGFKAGWRFVRLCVTERQELVMQNFLAAQLGKPLNRPGQLSVLFFPIPGEGESYFCSELVAAALEAAGVINYDEWPGVTQAAEVAPHELFSYLNERCTTVRRELLPGNPVRMRDVVQQSAARGTIPLRSGRIPMSVDDHAAGASNSSVANFISALPPPDQSAPPTIGLSAPSGMYYSRNTDAETGRAASAGDPSRIAAVFV
jgi:hypothetical protein